MTTINLELLIGKLVVDRYGERVGRIEEIGAENRGDETVVTSYLVGKKGAQQRFSIHHLGKGVARFLGAQIDSLGVHEIPWEWMDLTDPEHPRLTCSADELAKPRSQ